MLSNVVPETDFEFLREWLDAFRTIDWKPLKWDLEHSGVLGFYANVSGVAS
jgi:hypothetical protein